ncbi:MAG TPA: xylose isomerase, partial [Verrucomicrobiae bacterium]|nr:xylose isomerase [Verrucomicrobiae bacterium]
MTTQAFPDISKIEFEGPKSTQPLAFKHYHADEKIDGKSMRDHLRFAVCYWHTFRNPLSDPFGVGTAIRPWDDGTNSVVNAQRRVHAAFEFIEKLGAPFYCFHDRDVAPEGKDLRETNRNLDAVVKVLKEEQARTGVKLLWGTANLFSNPRYAHGAATSCNADAFAFAAAQVKKALEVTHELGGAGYVFWGGREGYSTLLNTDLKREQAHLARFLHMAVDYKKAIGFKGQFFIEPKPKEPTKHQYDFDVATVIAFLKTYGLTDRFKLNVEANHANLAGHSFHHEIALASAHGLFGSVDANRGDLLL